MPTSRTFQVEIRTGQRTKLEVNVYSRTLKGYDKMLINADNKGALTVDEITEVIAASVRHGLISEISGDSNKIAQNDTQQLKDSIALAVEESKAQLESI